MSALPIQAPQALYRFFSADGDLLYVGITLDPGARLKQHRADKPWWIEVATVTIEAHPDRASVEAAEREAITTERPRYNVAACPDCGAESLPAELHPDAAGWLAIYQCCTERAWAREVAA